MGTLFIVATPIGNLEDISARALDVLRAVPLIAAEDTRHSRKLLNHYAITTRLTSYHEHNERSKSASLLDLLAGGDIALITDAGTPGISDPGHVVIRAALDAGYHIAVVPGASAIPTALAASGLPAHAYRFLGFPPRKEGQIRALFAAHNAQPETLVLYESPNRLLKTLTLAQAELGDRSACVALEITKFFEEFTRGSLSHIHAHYNREPIRGEVTLMIAGAS